jgi:signal transduction histidine kinase
MNLYGISDILTAVTSLFLAVFVYFKARERKLGRIWSLFALSAAFYGFGAYMLSNSAGLSEAFFWWKIAYIGIIPLPFFFVWLVYEFLNIRRPLVIKLMGGLTAIYLILNLFLKKILLSDLTLYFTDMKWVKPIYFSSPTHPLLMFFILFNFFGWVIYGHIELIRNYHKISGIRRNQAKYFFFAATLGFTGGGMSFLPCFGISFYPIFNFAVPLYFLITAYAILRYRLMDIRVAITRTGIFVVVYTLVLGIPYALSVWGKNWLIATFGQNWWLGPPLVLLTILGIVGPFIYIYLQRRAEVIILRRQRTYQDTLKQAARELSRIHKLKKLLNLIVHIVTKTVGITYAAIYLFDEESQRFILKARRNIKKNVLPNSITKENSLVRWLKDSKETLVYEEINIKAYEGAALIFEELEEEMRSLDAAVIVPGLLKDSLLGFLILGTKRSGDFYTAQDLDTLSVIANQAALAVENASLYENMEEEIRQRTEELVTTQKQLIHAEKLATVGTLAGGVAHEINNPLTAILTNVQMLLATENTMDTDSKESLQLIEEATKRCRTIVQKLMTYAKKPLEPGEISKVDLSKAIKNVVSFLGYQLEQENIRVVTEAENGAYWVMGSQNELEQVFTNIILNARDAIRKIKKSGAIYINFSEDNHQINISIKDEGCGIPKEIISKIFDPFFTTKEVGKGTGLGLSICQAIVEKHNGKISVQSEVNKGSIFTVQLPTAKV